MSKMTNLSAALQDLRAAAETILSATGDIETLFNKESPAPAKELTLVDVRAVLAEKSRNGHTAAIRALLEKYDADKLSDIDPAQYPALLKDAEALGNG
jgi:hypothetical protein